MILSAVQGDITEQRVTAIVNAANERMRGGGGVDGAIHQAAGPGLLRELVDRFPDGLPTGQAGWSSGHALAAPYVIHVVGPIYDGSGGNRHHLESCYARALGVADELIAAHDLGDFSIAFPLVSAGVYGWPKDDAIRCAIDTLRDAHTHVTSATLVAFDHSTLTRIEAVL
ncbi:MAG TPA: macro domain-containing protein [Nocardioidaceae bacterium]|nr:macro domain-containing protein [Nocardioidaceae bacterium]